MTQPIYIDDDCVLPGIPNGAGVSSLVVEGAGYRIIIDDDLDVDGNWGYESAPICAGSAAGTLSLSFNLAAGLISITGSGIDPFTFVKVERSTDQQHWTTVRGGVSVAITNGGFTLNDYEFTDNTTNYYRYSTLAPFGCQTSTPVGILPQLNAIWFKSINRPFLNFALPIDCFDDSTSHPIELLTEPNAVSRAPRSGIFPIVNRTYPIAVNDLRLARQWTIMMRTWTTAALRTVDFLLASGDVIFIQTPLSYQCADTIEYGYVSAVDAGYVRNQVFRNEAIWTIGVVEVATPGPDIVYAAATWQTVINTYGSWAAVVAANPTWAAVLALLPSPTEVIVQ